MAPTLTKAMPSAPRNSAELKALRRDPLRGVGGHRGAVCKGIVWRAQPLAATLGAHRFASTRRMGGSLVLDANAGSTRERATARASHGNRWYAVGRCATAGPREHATMARASTAGGTRRRGRQNDDRSRSCEPRPRRRTCPPAHWRTLRDMPAHPPFHSNLYGSMSFVLHLCWRPSSHTRAVMQHAELQWWSRAHRLPCLGIVHAGAVCESHRRARAPRCDVAQATPPSRSSPSRVGPGWACSRPYDRSLTGQSQRASIPVVQLITYQIRIPAGDNECHPCSDAAWDVLRASPPCSGSPYPATCRQAPGVMEVCTPGLPPYVAFRPSLHSVCDTSLRARPTG